MLNTRFPFKKSILASLLSLILASQAWASVVRNDIDYQYFRNFATNKGQFAVGNKNIEIKNLQGEVIATMMTDAPMPDFSSVNKGSGVATLFDNQYIVSVAHNGGYQSVGFGETHNNPDGKPFTYNIVDRNNYPDDKKRHTDYHAPRLHKMVTEVAPAHITEAGVEGRDYADKKRFPIFVQLGSGTQQVRDDDFENGKELDSKEYGVAGAYAYLTGGTTTNVGGVRTHWIDSGSPTYKDAYSVMTTTGLKGDSGSPVFAYDTVLAKWVLVGTLNFTNAKGTANTWSIMRPDYHEQKRLEDLAATLNAGNFEWTPNAETSTITGAATVAVPLKANITTADGKFDEKASLNHGKTVIFAGDNGTLTLKGDINQGAGGLYFRGDYLVNGTGDFTHQGAGVDVAKDKTVIWQIKNPQGDRLSKLGQGVLHVKGAGENLGDISVGDGTVILEQTGGQAFHQVGIVSGRPTVVLTDDKQVDTDNIYFGYRGGRLDVHGNDITFNRIQNVDEGARIVNHSDQEATVTIKGSAPKTADDIIWKERGQWGGDLYAYKHQYVRNRTDYFALKGDTRRYFPTNHTSNDHWEYLGNDKDEVIKNHLTRANAERKLTAFNGVLGETDVGRKNGALNVVFDPAIDGSKLLLSGGSKLNGELVAKGGELVLSGRPTPYATGKMTITTDENGNKKYSYNAGVENIYDDDWINREFVATRFVADGDSALTVGRNVSRTVGDFVATDTATLNLGIGENSTHCMRSDLTGKVSCGHAITPAGLAASPITQMAGNLTLSDKAVANLGKIHLTGKVTGDTDTTIHMDKNATLILVADSQAGKLHLTDGAVVKLNHQQAGEFHTLTVGELSGVGQFHYTTDLAKNQGDKLIVQGTATGTHTLAVQNTGAEPAKSKDRLTLVRVNGDKANTATFALAGGAVDVGALRYELLQENNEYRLYNPIVEKQLDDEAKAEQEAKRLAQIQAEKLAQEQRLAQEKAEQEAKIQAEQAQREAKKLAEEKRLAEERRLAQEQENADRLAKQLAEEAQAKKLAEEKIQAEKLAQQKAEQDAKAQADFEATIRVLSEQADKEYLAWLTAEKEMDDLAIAKKLAQMKQDDTEKARLAELEKQKAQEALAKFEAAERTKAELEASKKLAEEKAQAERLAKEKAEQDIKNQQLAKEKAEKEAQNLAEAQRLVQEKQLANEKAKQEAQAKKLAEEKIQAEKLAQEQRLAQEKAEQEAKIQAEQAQREAQKLAEEKRLAEEKAQKLAEAEKLAQEKAEQETQTKKPAEQTDTQQQTQTKQESPSQTGEKPLQAIDTTDKKPKTEPAPETPKTATPTAQPQPVSTATQKPQAALMSRYSNVAVAQQSSGVRTLVRLGQGIDDELGAIRAIGGRVWTNVQHFDDTIANDHHRAYDKSETMTHIGAEKTVQTQFGQATIGAAVSHSRGDDEFADGFKGSSRATTAHLYGKAQTIGGAFVQGAIGAGTLDGELEHGVQTTKTDSRLVSSSLSVGKTLATKALDITPSVGVQYASLSGDEYELDGASVRTHDSKVFSQTAKLSLSKSLQIGQATITPTVQVAHTISDDKLTTSVNDQAWHQELADTTRYKVGASVQAGSVSGSAFVGQSISDDTDDSLEVGVKVSYWW